MNFFKKNVEYSDNNKSAVTKIVAILTLCLITTIGIAQNKKSKTIQTIKVNNDVVVDLNTNYIEIEIDTWNEDVVDVEAYVESSTLSDDELKKSLAAWNLNVEASMDHVIISSEGGRRPALFSEGSYNDFLKSYKSPQLTPSFNYNDVLKSYKSTQLTPSFNYYPLMLQFSDMPGLPEFPEFPDLPEGVNTIDFDYDKYQKEGENYLAEWSKRYEKEGGKELQKRMEDWAKTFVDSGYQEQWAKWGEEYGMRFEGKWAEYMEQWGEKFGKDMEKWAEGFKTHFEKQMEQSAALKENQKEKLTKAQLKRAEKLDKRRAAMQAKRESIIKAQLKRVEELDKRREAMQAKREYIIKAQLKRAEELDKRRAAMQAKLESIILKGYSGSESQVKRVLKIKIPKKANLKLNVRHGEIKIASVLHNIKGDVSHTNFLAKHIDGSATSINISYSNVLVNDWKNGTLSLKYVDDAILQNVESLTLNSNSSNIGIDYLSGNNIIDSSFGELTVHHISDTFNNLNIILENSDAWLKLPKVDCALLFKGERSKFNDEITKTKTVSANSGKSIVINAKYGSVTAN